MNKDAQLILVANRFLKYPQILQDCLGMVETMAQTSKFNLYRCKKIAIELIKIIYQTFILKAEIMSYHINPVDRVLSFFGMG